MVEIQMVENQIGYYLPFHFFLIHKSLQMSILEMNFVESELEKKKSHSSLGYLNTSASCKENLNTDHVVKII